MRRESDRLQDMLAYSRRIRDRVASVARAEFDDDPDLQLALTYLIQVVGEAASHVSGETRTRSPLIPWTQIVGMRQIMVHGYFAVNIERVWLTASRDIPDLVRLLETYIVSEPSEEDDTLT